MQLVLEVASLQFEKWSYLHILFFAVFSGLGSKLLEIPILWADSTWCGGKPFSFGRIPAGGKVRTDEELPKIDMIYGGINRFIVAPTYFCHMARLIQQSDFDFSLTIFTPVWALAQCLALFAIYDSVYTPLHRLAHVRSIYGWIHKHHHRQLVPYRGTYDAVNEHPLELLVGAYIHVFALRTMQAGLRIAGQWLVGFALHVHVLAVGAFLAASVVMGSLNHTRVDVNVPKVFSVRDHDTHHRVFTTNYGQYTMWIDKLTGSYQPYCASASAKEQ